MGKAGKQTSFYAVQIGRKPGIYASWDEARPFVDGFSAARYKKFTTKAAAEAFIRQDGRESESSATVTKPRPSAKVTKPRPSAKVTKPRPSAKATASNIPETVFIGGLTVMGGRDKPIPIYTDGASRNNQSQDKAKAGYGIFFGTGHPDNVSKPLPGMPQTNQRAELLAIYEACKIVRDRDDDLYYDIRTDSQYSISCLKDWYKNWRKNGWKNSAGADVSNKDIIEPAVELLESLGSRVRFTKVKGHSKDPGNDAADALAVKGAEM